MYRTGAMNENPSYSPRHASDRPDRIARLTAKAFEEIRPIAELDSRSTLTLLTSLVLIGLSLASRKPDSVEVLGFTLQADHWLILAAPLALVVMYAMMQLTIVWNVERWRYQNSESGTLGSILQELEAAGEDLAERRASFDQKSDEADSKRKEIWDWYKAQMQATLDRERELNRESRKDLFGKNKDNFRQQREQLEEKRAQLERERDRKMEKSGVADFDRQVKSKFTQLRAGELISPEVVIAQKCDTNLKRIIAVRKVRVWLEFYVPLLVAIASIIVLAIAAVNPTWL
jgi:membrane protein YdbS with pleckstrin-like domain